MQHHKTLAVGLAAVVVIAAAAAFLSSGLLTSRAVQNPSMSFDMVVAGNTYDETTNTMTVGTIQNCLTTAPPGNAAQHLHPAHLVIQNVEDLVGWQARMNYLGDRMRIATVSFAMFTDNNTGQNISFLSLPIDPLTLVHRDQVNATDIPPGASGPQTALIGSVYQGEQNFGISPDSPHKTTPDDASYNAPTGGILATVNLQVLSGNAGNPSLFMNMDDGSPNSPGSDLQIFTSGGLVTVSPPVNQLGDAYHGEGATCVPLNCTSLECPGPTPPVDPTPPPSPTITESPGTITITPSPTATRTATATATATGATTGPCPTSPNFRADETFTRGPGEAASDLHAEYQQTVIVCNVRSPAGCPQPTVSTTSQLGLATVDIDWGTACVDPGESVVYTALFTGPPCRYQAFWTLSGQNIGPAGPGGIPSCGGPTSTATPGTITPTPTPATVTPTATAIACPPPGGPDETFTRPAGQQAASDLHAQYNGPVKVCNVRSPAGCPAPSVTAGPSSTVDIDWGTACVDPGESVTYTIVVFFTPAPPGACRISANWTLSGANIGPAGPGGGLPSPCTTPTPTATAPPTLTLTPTPGTVTPSPTATATPTATPGTAGHDARLTKIGGVPKNVRLSPGEVIADSANVVVANDGNHSETIGVYVDVMAPAGCTPSGRVLQTTVTLGAGNKTTLSFPVSYSCSDPQAANGSTYSWTAVADHGADDLASCPPGSLLGIACFNALADDDADPADNRKSRSGPRVVAQ